MQSVGGGGIKIGQIGLVAKKYSLHCYQPGGSEQLFVAGSVQD